VTTVLIDIDSVSSEIGRVAATEALVAPTGPEAGDPDEFCGSVSAVESAGPPYVDGFAIAFEEVDCCSQIAGGSKYFFSATFTENFCEVDLTDFLYQAEC
jgi:hypothetical protein